VSCMLLWSSLLMLMLLWCILLLLVELWGPSRHLESLTAANWGSFVFNVSYSSFRGYSFISTFWHAPPGPLLGPFGWWVHFCPKCPADPKKKRKHKSLSFACAPEYNLECGNANIATFHHQAKTRQCRASIHSSNTNAFHGKSVCRSCWAYMITSLYVKNLMPRQTHIPVYQWHTTWCQPST
jgi:hypothetical protein